MATFMERKGRFTACVRMLGFKGYTRTFATKEEGAAWAAEIEDRLKRIRATDKGVGYTGDGRTQANPLTLSEVLILPRIRLDDSAVGVYFLLKDNECVYVGQSRQVHTRVREHKHQRNGTKDFNSYCWIAVSPDRLDEIELHYITLLQPKLNEKGSEVAKLKNRLNSKSRTRIEKRQIKQQLAALALQKRAA